MNRERIFGLADFSQPFWIRVIRASLHTARRDLNKMHYKIHYSRVTFVERNATLVWSFKGRAPKAWSQSRLSLLRKLAGCFLLSTF